MALVATWLDLFTIFPHVLTWVSASHIPLVVTDPVLCQAPCFEGQCPTKVRTAQLNSAPMETLPKDCLLIIERNVITKKDLRMFSRHKIFMIFVFDPQLASTLS